MSFLAKVIVWWLKLNDAGCKHGINNQWDIEENIANVIYYLVILLRLYAATSSKI